MGYNAILSDAAVFYRGVVKRAGGRGARTFQTVKDPPGTDGFVYPFILPQTPDVPIVMPIVQVEGEITGGGGVTRPTYKAPAFTISASPLTGEVGDTINVAVSASWTQNDAGTASNYRLTLTGETPYTNAAGTTAYTFANVALTDTPKTLSGRIAHSAGAIKNDSEGNPYPAGAIGANANLASNNITISGYRKAFWGTTNAKGTAPTTSAQVRALGNESTAGAQKSFKINIPLGDWDTIIAIPASLGNNIDIRAASYSGVDYGVAFTKSTVGVDGLTTGQDNTPYNVWYFSPDEANIVDDVYTITISG